MKNTALVRSIPYWLLLVLSLAAVGVGGWLTADQIGVMTATLLDGTATGIEVYAGQAWVVVGGALLTGGLVGLFLALGLAAARTLVPRPRVEVVESIDWTGTDEATDPALGSDAAESVGQDAEAPVDAEHRVDAEEPVVTGR